MSYFHILSFSLFSRKQPSRGISPSDSLPFPGNCGGRQILLLCLLLSASVLGEIPFWQDSITPVWGADRATVLPMAPLASTNLPVYTLDQTIRLALGRNPEIAKKRALTGQKAAHSIEAG